MDLPSRSLWQETAASASEEKAGRAMCSFRVAERLYGVSIAKVREILGPTRPWPVPLAPAFVGGLVHYRGEVLTTVSLRVLFGLPPLEEDSSVLVVDSAGGCYGLLVDRVVEVVEVVEVGQACFEESPANLEEGRRSLLCGVHKLEKGLLIEMDPAMLDPLRLAFDAAPDARAAAGWEFASGTYCPLPGVPQ
ncbi:MAG: chemotaxis protein CheW [Acidobacteriaceae bacterium]